MFKFQFTCMSLSISKRISTTGPQTGDEAEAAPEADFLHSDPPRPLMHRPANHKLARAGSTFRQILKVTGTRPRLATQSGMLLPFSPKLLLFTYGVRQIKGVKRNRKRPNEFATRTTRLVRGRPSNKQTIDLSTPNRRDRVTPKERTNDPTNATFLLARIATRATPNSAIRIPPRY